MFHKLITNIDKRFLVPTLATIYALISVQNIAHFFEGLNHGRVMSWTAGIAIGATLVILAHYLSETPMSDRNAFNGLLAVTLVFVVLTTLIQGSNYAHTLGVVGYLFAFVLAGAGELALPLAYAVAENAKRRREVTEASQMAEQIAAETVVSVMRGLDVSKAQKQAEKRIEGLIVAHVDSTVRKLMPQDTPSVNERTINNDQTPNVRLSTLDDANAKRIEKANTRRQQLLSILMNEFDGVDVSNLNRTQLASRLNTTRQTIARDLSALQDTNLLKTNGEVNVVS